MLNIFKLKKKNLNINTLENEGDYIRTTRYYLPANKEWFNSIYTYNKNKNKLLSTLDNYTIKLIRSYFNMYSRILEKKIKSRPRRFRTWKRILSSRKIIVSKPELKHTNDKIIITLYIFNRQKNYFLRKINRIVRLSSLKTFFLKKVKVKILKKVNSLKLKKVKKLLLLSKNLKNIFKVFREKNIIIKNLKLNKFLSNYENNELKIYVDNILKNFIKRYLKKEIFALYFKQIIFFNRFKFKYTYLIPLKKLLEKFYNKKIEFNLVSLKYFFLNSDIFSQIVTNKIRNRKNKPLRVLKSSLRKIKTPILNKNTVFPISHKFIGIQNNIINDIFDSKFLNDKLNNILDCYFLEKNIEENIISSIKYKIISGIRVQASGRISKRITAARAILKFRYVGTLKNIDSSYKNLSSSVIRGNEKSNLQYTKSKSKTRIGAFGLKSWISGY